MDKSENFKQFRNDPKSYRLGLVYYNSQDPCLVLPKRIGYGWTINFAHRYAYIALLASVIIAIGPALLVASLMAAFRVIDPIYLVGVTGAVVLGSVFALIYLSVKLSDRPI